MSYRKAIERQRALLEQNPNDLRLLQKLGELLQKAGDQTAAAEAFFHVANCYLRDGFMIKAALLKQVLKLHPRLTAAREVLAITYAQLDLMAEAIELYRALLRDYAVLERAEDAGRVAMLLARIESPGGGTGVAGVVRDDGVVEKATLLHQAHGARGDDQEQLFHLVVVGRRQRQESRAAAVGGGEEHFGAWVR